MADKLTRTSHTAEIGASRLVGIRLEYYPTDRHADMLPGTANHRLALVLSAGLHGGAGRAADRTGSGGRIPCSTVAHGLALPDFSSHTFPSFLLLLCSSALGSIMCFLHLPFTLFFFVLVRVGFGD